MIVLCHTLQMREKCDVEKQLKVQRDEESRIAAEELAKAVESMGLKEKAATYIQACWRGWLARHQKPQRATMKQGGNLSKSKRPS